MTENKHIGLSQIREIPVGGAMRITMDRMTTSMEITLGETEWTIRELSQATLQREMTGMLIRLTFERLGKKINGLMQLRVVD
jgi:uncharacterized coiled-coil protein SlyX